MTTAIRDWWDGMSLRERWLVGLAGVLASALVAWFLIWLPLQSALSNAVEAHGIAIDRQAGIAVRVAEIKRLEGGGAATAAAASEAAVNLILAQSAAEKGLTLSRNDPVGQSGTNIAIANARAPALSTWLMELESTGVTAQDLTIRPNADGTVALTATMQRAP